MLESDVENVKIVTRQLCEVIVKNNNMPTPVLLSALSNTFAIFIAETVSQLDKDVAMDVVSSILSSIKSESFKMAYHMEGMK